MSKPNHPRKYIDTTQAPAAIGTYSQAVKVDDTVFISGQIPLAPDSHGELIEGDFTAQLQQVFDNLRAICEAAGGNLDSIVKLNIYLTDLNNFALVNKEMPRYFNEPYPARAVLGVASLPKGSPVEMDAVMMVHQKMEF